MLCVTSSRYKDYSINRVQGEAGGNFLTAPTLYGLDPHPYIHFKSSCQAPHTLLNGIALKDIGVVRAGFYRALLVLCDC